MQLPRRLTARSGVVTVVAVAALSAAPALAGTSHAKFWEALGNDLNCGLAIHAPGAPGEVLCSGTGIPAPKHGSSFGDPGFVFLGTHGRPRLVRLSQDEFQSSTPLRLSSGRSWSALGVSCEVHRTNVRCANRSGHGFSVTKHGYAAF